MSSFVLHSDCEWIHLPLFTPREDWLPWITDGTSGTSDGCSDAWGSLLRKCLIRDGFCDNVHAWSYNASDWGWNTCERGCLSIVFCLLVTWLLSLLTCLAKFGTTELEGKLGLLTVLCNLLTYFFVVKILGVVNSACAGYVLLPTPTCLPFRLGRVKHNGFVECQLVKDLGQNDLGKTGSSLTESPRWHSEIREWTSHGLWCCIPGLTSITFWSVQNDLCTPCFCM